MNNRIEVRASRTPTEEILIKKCWKPDCNNVAVLRDGSGWEWCDKHVDQEKTGSVLHTEEERYDANYYRTKLRTALTTIAEESYKEGAKDEADLKGERRRIIEQLREEVMREYEGKFVCGERGKQIIIPTPDYKEYKWQLVDVGTWFPENLTNEEDPNNK